MPFFRYKAYNREGKELTAIEEALSVNHLKKILTSKGLIPYEIEEVTTKEKRKNLFQIDIFKRKKISNEELSLLLYEIGILLERNIHITQIFDILSKQTENMEIKKALLSAKTSLQEGSSIAESLGKTGIFPNFLTEMIRAGETSGAVDKIFLSASEFIQKQEEFKRQVVNSLIYPSIVIGVGFLAMIVIMNYVVPTITNIYQQFGKELPTSTKIVVAMSEISSFFIKFIPLIIVLLIIFRKKIMKRDLIDQFKLKIPFFKKVHLYSIYSTWSNTLSLLLKGGLTLDRALEISNETINNTSIKKRFNTVTEEIKKGKSLSDLLTKEKLLPENTVMLIKIGEETGQLDRMLSLISQIYKKQTERLISVFLSYLEPVVLIILSVLIGFFVFATLLPIFDLSIK
ncbi:type II secretion system F family protein [Persephonella sp.]